MKKTVLTVLLVLSTLTLSSQTFKLETVFSDKVTETYLSYWKVLDSESISSTFSLWGYHLYFDDWSKGAYEVEYFKGNAVEMHDFLVSVCDFTDKYRDEDKVVTYISGVKVKTIKSMGFKYTLVFDPEGKVPCMFNGKQWNDMLAEFESYCEKLNLKF